MLLAALAALAGAAVQSATGFGFALILSPALFAVLEPYEAITALLMLGLALNALVLVEGAADVRWRELAPVLVAALPGLALGVVALELAPKPALQIAVGLAVIATVAWRLRRVRRAAAPAVPSGGRAAAVGVLSGALTTSINISGPPLVLWLEARRLTPRELRGSLAAAFLALNLVGGLVVLVAGGADSAADPATLLPLLGLVVAGHLLGARVFVRLDPEAFARAVLVLVVVAGLASVAAGLAAL